MSDLNPGDRVKLVCIQPHYLEGARGTVVRPQPGEERTLVRLDNDPQARKWKGMDVCLSNASIVPDDSTDPLFRLIRDQIDPAAERVARAWLADIAPLVDEAASNWGFNHAPEFLGDNWYELYKPTLLWRFYWHLSNQIRMIAEGHETVLFQNRRET